MASSHSSSDEDEDVVVLRVCANRNCQRTDNLEYDEEAGELYCGHCRELFSRTEQEGFSILLTDEDRPLIALIFKAFDKEKKGYWNYKDWVSFQSHTDHSSEEAIDSDVALKKCFKDEYDIDLKSNPSGECVVYRGDLEEMYGGYFFNHVNALTEDAYTLEDEGIVNTEVLE